MQDEIDVIRQVTAGKTESFRILVTRYERSVFSFVRNMVTNTHESEDLTQDVFLSAFLKLGSFNPDRGAFSTWLLAIARNRCLSALKRPRPLPRAFAPDAAEDRTPEFAPADRELLDLLDAALAELPVEQKTAFVLSEFCELSQEAISEVERTSLGTVKSRISRAKAKLRAALGRLVEES